MSDVARNALDVAGMVPIVGTGADLINTGIYAAEGDYFNAGASGISAIPILGDAVGGARLAVKYGDDVVGAVAHAGDDVASGGLKLVDDAAGAAASSAPPGTASPPGPRSRSRATIRSRSRSFAVGDRVDAWNEASGEVESRTVTAVHVNHDPVSGTVVVADEPIETTPHHPFFTIERGWVDAEDLRPGDHVPSTDGSSGVVSSVTWTGGSATMYDLTVEVAHTYFVGEGEWLVHNCGLPAMDPALIRYSQSSMGSAFRNGQSVQSVADALASGRLSPGAFPPIRLVERGGHFHTLDKRRLAAFQTAGIPVPYRMATRREIANEAWKFSTQNDGIGIQLTLPLN